MEIGAVSSVLPARTVSGQTPQRQEPAAAEVAREQPAQPPHYLNPIGRYDQVARLFVLEFRDDADGEVKSQIPPERIVEEYRRLGFRRAAGVGGDGDAGEPLLTGRPLTTRLPDSVGSVQPIPGGARDQAAEAEVAAARGLSALGQPAEESGFTPQLGGTVGSGGGDAASRGGGSSGPGGGGGNASVAAVQPAANGSGPGVRQGVVLSVSV